MKHRVFVTMLLLAVTAFCAPAARVWEPADRMPSQALEQLTQTDDITTAVADGYLYLTLRQRAAVRLFTILGQPVVQSTLAPGTYRFRLPSRGIYLLKIGSTIRRITI